MTQQGRGEEGWVLESDILRAASLWKDQHPLKTPGRVAGFACIRPKWLHGCHLGLMPMGPLSPVGSGSGFSGASCGSNGPGHGATSGLLRLHEVQADTHGSSMALQGSPTVDFPWQLRLLLDPTCLVELSKGARGSLKSNCRFLGNDTIIGSMISRAKPSRRHNLKASICSYAAEPLTWVTPPHP